MPQLNVLCWNIEDLGINDGFRARQARVGMIARVVANAQADIVCIQELRAAGIAASYLPALQEALNALPAPFNNWYYGWILGGAAGGGAMPWATAADLQWSVNHNEGYALFWNQNIAKFTMQAAAPIEPPTFPPAPAAAPVANTQSAGTFMTGAVGFGMPPVFVPLYGQQVPLAGITVPPAGGNQYVIPIGSHPPGGVPSVAAAFAPQGTIIPAGSTIGGAGITLANQVNNVNPVVVPGNFVLTDALTLPNAASVLVPGHALELVMTGRDTGNAMHVPATGVGNIAPVPNFVPGAANQWNWLYFMRSGGWPAAMTGPRRPAYVTIRVNRPAALAGADQLVPITFFHAPAAAAVANSSMQRASYGRQMYQAYDWTVPGWIDCNNALIGGDFNVRMDTATYGYAAYTNAFAAGGAGCTMAVANPAPPGQTMADNVLNKSMAAINFFGGGGARWSNALNDFRSRAIDNIFYRGLGGGVVAGGTGLGDLLTGSFGPFGAVGGALTGAAIQNCINVPNMVQAQTAWLTGVVAVFPNMNQSATSLRDMQQGRMGYYADYGLQNTRARRTAEFVNLFVSDHLPVNIQFNM